MIKQIFFFSVVALIIASQVFADDTNHPVIKKIEIIGNRVRESVIRKELTFNEGDRVDEQAIQDTKENLYKLGLFKSVEVRQQWSDDLDGVEITVDVKDGWYVFPWPIIGTRGGDVFAAVLVSERNLLRWGEGITLWGSYSKDNYTGMGSLYLSDFYFMSGINQVDRIEYQFKDGGFNTKDFDNAWGSEQPEDFGDIVASYEKEVLTYHLGVGIPPNRDWKGGIRFISSDTTYSAGSLGNWYDGQDNSLELSVGYGKALRKAGGFGGGFGRLFGMGLAGLKESLKPLEKQETSWEGELTTEYGSPVLGSDDTFTKMKGAVKVTTLFRKRNYLEIAVNGGAGVDLPESRLFKTDRTSGLKGVYAREFRGDSIATTTMEYAHHFFMNRIGGLTGKGFIDLAWCRQDDLYRQRQGVGAEVSYRFWRFPLPLGMGATYSVDDGNLQFSFAMGGSF